MKKLKKNIYSSSFKLIKLCKQNGFLFIGISAGIELAQNIVIDLAGKKVVGVELFNASEILSSLTGQTITKNSLASITEVKICYENQKGLLFTKLFLSSKKMASPLMPVITASLNAN